MTHADEIQANFETFHAAYPGVYRLFDRFTREMIATGLSHGSAGLIFERIRWEYIVFLEGNLVTPKLNNNYRSRYARLWEKDNPEHAGFFRKRRLRPVSVDSTARAQEEYL